MTAGTRPRNTPPAAASLRQAFALARIEADGLVKRRLGWALIFVIMTAALAALAPIALKYAVDALERGEPIGLFDVGGMASGPALMLGPIALVAFYLLGLWASRSFGELRWFLYGTADRRLHRNLSRRLLDHVLKLPMSFHLDRRTGGLNQTLVQGLAGYSILLNHAVFTLLPVLIEVVLIGAVLLFFLELEFLLILLFSVVAYAAAFAIGVRSIIGPSRAVAETQVDAYANLTDSILNAETVKYFTAERHVGTRYDEALATSESEWRRFYWRKSLNGLLVALVFACSLGAAIILGARQVMAGQMTVGDFVLVNAYMLQIVRPMETLGAAFRDIAHGAAFLEKMTGLMVRDIEYPDRSSSSTELAHCAPGAGRLEFDAVGFAYLPGRPVLHDINFVVASGRTVGIVGGSGAGKSSIIRLLMRLYDPDSGEIRLNGVSTRAMPLEELRRAIAVVPQDAVLFNESIAYNIGFGRPNASLADIEQAARFAHIHDKITAMPDGYQTRVGERGLKLSGGEKQRVSIARAVLKRPQLFVFDEATSSLDSKTERGILDNLIEVSKGMTTLIIAHRLSTVRHADEILVVDQGRIVERGDHHALLEQGGAYVAMWKIQNGKLLEA
ncbi:ABC transporter ATP-binding protein/permease [Parasphingopyxis algicola]|uniref:ATP-binding cassette domain-containing protein n=1 Tax=Parasphingopyxis algicola TaxID=2026624 RepID=UPI0015A4D2C9|nr:ATP-binding cassette domain-containing protein [Parasphingopyxis algicola]QLC24897.1 ABC transporter ATP-binding protein/permease [Parasphingopyxis algicola]